jgi:hypothetical protein
VIAVEPISPAPSDLSDAALLLRYAFQPRLLPARDATYLRIVRSWPTRPGLQRAAESIADGLGIWIVTVDATAGIVCAAESDSPFELKMGDFLRQARAESQWGQRVVFAVALLAVWRLCYPRPAHLDDPERVPRISCDEVIAYVDGLCTRLDEAAEVAGEEVDPPLDEPELERAWRAWQRRSKSARTPDGRRSPRTTTALVARALEWMVEQGLLDQVNDDEGGTYRARPRLRVLVREAAATAVYETVVRLAAGSDDTDRTGDTGGDDKAARPDPEQGQEA